MSIGKPALARGNSACIVVCGCTHDYRAIDAASIGSRIRTNVVSPSDSTAGTKSGKTSLSGEENGHQRRR
jgi:hypothetical protein